MASSQVINSIISKYETYNGKAIKQGIFEQGDWVIIRMVKEDPREESFMNDYLFNVTSWKPSDPPLLQSDWTDNFSKGVRDGGFKLEFGASDELLELSAFDGQVVKRHVLSSLLT
eukprot:TRINITY_DN6231_c0_g1_i1.p1 TRINITY_DN6231_c0_g1~~TRINITY_DN6231_c0_g1_i1.p1  ORF type:complete len:115 (+),score=24.86 TRINITY_DN6231_c0_g1_i1:98-442(+)